MNGVSAGLLHSSAQLIELIPSLDGTSVDAVRQMGTILVSPVSDVVNLCARANWLAVNADGQLVLTSRGETLRATTDFRIRLRLQLADCVRVMQVAWSRLIPYGRSEFARFAPADIVQCFEEAGAFESQISNAIVEWWDSLSALARGLFSDELLEIGRTAERLTINFERDRTQREPLWQALESQHAGYDVLSVVERGSSKLLQIEVKGSIQSLKNAHFFLTPAEWAAAQGRPSHRFDLWLLTKSPMLASLSREDVMSHIPENCGLGSWQGVKIPFEPFRTRFVAQKTAIIGRRSKTSIRAQT